MDASDNPLQRSYDRVAGDYADHIADELSHKPLDRALLDAFAEMVDATGIVADIGCGPGHVGAYLHERGLTVHGIDLSSRMVELARRRYPTMTFEVGSMLDLQTKDARWTGIVAFYSIIHITSEDLSTVFRHFFRALVSGGLVLLAFHTGDKHVHLDEWWGHEVSVDSYFHSRELVDSHLERAGFELRAHLERLPDEEIEYPTRRVYVLARKP